MKRLISLCLAGLCALVATACSADAPALNLTPSQSKMRAICELALMECYYHNVAKFKLEDAAGALWWKKDKHFWVEYNGVVQFGLDFDKLSVTVNEDTVTIHMPRARVLSVDVDEASLTPDSYIVDKNSAAITAEDEVYAFEKAQEALRNAAASDTALLAQTQNNAEELLCNYIKSIGDLSGVEYKVNIIPLKEDTTSSPTTEPTAKPASNPSSQP